MYQINQSEMDTAQRESLYDVPLNNRRISDRQARRAEVTESIYDVPRSLLRKMAEHALEPHPGGEMEAVGGDLLEDVMASLEVSHNP